MTKFEKKLKLLFDAQSFFRNPELGAIIERETANALADDELGLLFAAGDPFAEKWGREADDK